LEGDDDMDKNGTRKHSTFENSIYMLRSIKKETPLAFWLIFAIVPFGVLGPFFSIYLPKVLISGIENNLEPIQIIKNTVIVVLFLVIMKTAEIIIELAQYSLGINMRSYFSMNLYSEKLMDIDYSYLVAGNGMEEQSKVMEIVYGGDASLVHIFHQKTGKFLTSIAGIIFYGSLISSINFWLIIVIFIGAIINLIYGKYNANYRQKSIEKRSMDAKRLNYIQSKTGDFRSAKDMRLFEMKDWFMDNFHYYLSKWSKEYKKEKQISATGGIIDALIVFVRDGLAYLFLIGLYFSGEITISDFVLLFGAIVGFSEWLSNIV
jgi:ATP-binding cassette subfamily B protein